MLFYGEWVEAEVLAPVLQCRYAFTVPKVQRGAKWLEMLLQHVPDRGEHLVRYHGWCSNWVRGMRETKTADPETLDSVIARIAEQVDPEAAVVNNARFLILPWVRVAHLASKLLAMAARSLSAHWQGRYGYCPVLLETFVEAERFAGTCYRAASWTCVGQTQGRGKLGDHRLGQTPNQDGVGVSAGEGLPGTAVAMSDPQPIEIEAAEVERLIEQAQPGRLDAAAQKRIVPLLRTLLWLGAAALGAVRHLVRGPHTAHGGPANL